MFSPRRSGDRGAAGIDAAPNRRQRRDTIRDPAERVSEEDGPSSRAPVRATLTAAIPRRSTAAEKHSYSTIHSLSTAPGGFAINCARATASAPRHSGPRQGLARAPPGGPHGRYQTPPPDRTVSAGAAPGMRRGGANGIPGSSRHWTLIERETVMAVLQTSLLIVVRHDSFGEEVKSELSVVHDARRTPPEFWHRL